MLTDGPKRIRQFVERGEKARGRYSRPPFFTGADAAADGLRAEGLDWTVAFAGIFALEGDERRSGAVLETGMASKYMASLSGRHQI